MAKVVAKMKKIFSEYLFVKGRLKLYNVVVSNYINNVAPARGCFNFCFFLGI